MFQLSFWVYCVLKELLKILITSRAVNVCSCFAKLKIENQAAKKSFFAFLFIEKWEKSKHTKHTIHNNFLSIYILCYNGNIATVCYIIFIMFYRHSYVYLYVFESVCTFYNIWFDYCYYFVMYDVLIIWCKIVVGPTMFSIYFL